MINYTEGRISLNKGFEVETDIFPNYRHDFNSGTTILDGIIRVSNPNADRNVVGYLPSTVIRPPSYKYFPVITQRGVRECIISEMGEITVLGDTGSYLSLSGIVFNTHGFG